jgi:hypothetical protein
MGARAGGSILRHAAAAGLVGAIVTIALAWTGWGREAGLSALAGSLVVLVVLLVGLLGISVVVAGDAGLSMAGAAVVYIGQIILIVAALLVLRDRDWLDGRAFAIAAVVQVLVMQVAQVVGYNRGRHAVDAPLAQEGDRS